MFIYGLYIHLRQQQPKAPHWEALKRTIPVPNLVKCCLLLETRADCAEKTQLKQAPTINSSCHRLTSSYPEAMNLNKIKILSLASEDGTSMLRSKPIILTWSDFSRSPSNQTDCPDFNCPDFRARQPRGDLVLPLQHRVQMVGEKWSHLWGEKRSTTLGWQLLAPQTGNRRNPLETKPNSSPKSRGVNEWDCWLITVSIPRGKAKRQKPALAEPKLESAPLTKAIIRY